MNEFVGKLFFTQCTIGIAPRPGAFVERWYTGVLFVVGCQTIYSPTGEAFPACLNVITDDMVGFINFVSFEEARSLLACV